MRKIAIVNGVKIDENIADRLLRRVIIMEKENIKTKQYSTGDMIKRIKKKIEEEVECF